MNDSDDANMRTWDGHTVYIKYDMTYVVLEEGVLCTTLPYLRTVQYLIFPAINYITVRVLYTV